MLKAIHKTTGRIVWAFALENDASWIGKEKDEFIAPRYMVYDYGDKGDVKVFFTKTHDREGTTVRCHFKHESEREIYDKESESKEHQMAKEGVYEAICNGFIKIDGKELKDFCSDIQFEYPISNSKKSKIADVIAIFKEWHPIYGRGIVFEVQLSHQISEITEDRTFNRVTEGYSVCWLWDSDFDDTKLKTQNYDKTIRVINIIPFSKAIEEYQKLIESKSIFKINNAGLMLDKKLSELYLEMSNLNEYRNQIDKIEEDMKYKDNEREKKLNSFVQEELSCFNKKLMELQQGKYHEIINQSLDNFKTEFDRVIEKWKEAVTNQVVTKITNSSSIEQVVKEKVIGLIHEELSKDVYKSLISSNAKMFSEENIERIMHEIILKKITFKPHQIFDG